MWLVVLLLGVASAEEPLGALDRTVIDEVIAEDLHKIRRCYVRSLVRKPSLTGKVTIKFTIDPQGRVSSAEIKESALADEACEECLLKKFRKLRFPEPKGGGKVIVSYPFLFSPE